jgi:hypothetical protein
VIEMSEQDGTELFQMEADQQRLDRLHHDAAIRAVRRGDIDEAAEHVAYIEDDAVRDHAIRNIGDSRGK